ncbi:MAG: RNA polymerase sigma factor [Candidatus Daviesbacteria bacterium GW2011_GWA1_38_7]|nr:MAG: RNA polymerase sigma factor [Candidatus Daviesbacteria bacterium GW2011_GWA1_38_7]
MSRHPESIQPARSSGFPGSGELSIYSDANNVDYGLSAKDQYLRDIRRYHLLTAEEEVTLAQTREIGDAARDQINTLPPDDPGRADFAPLVRAGAVARRRLTDLDRAVTKYDPRTGYRFSTYAYWWIRQSVTRAFADQGRVIRLPIHVVERLATMNRESKEFEQEHGRLPSDEELADRTGIPVHSIAEAWEGSMTVSSIDRPVGDGDMTLEELIEDPYESPEEDEDKLAVQQDTARALDHLNPRERTIIEMRYGLGKWRGDSCNLSEIGEVLGYSRERIRQIEARALAKLRSPKIIRMLRGILD